jgi:hypothetical protein
MESRHAVPVLVGLALAAACFAAQAARSEGEASARSGVLRCGGNHHLRMGGSEVHFSNITLRNFDSAQAIAIDRLRVYDAATNVIFDSAASGLPPPTDGAIAGNVLAPNGSVVYSTLDLLPGFLPSERRPIQVQVDWSASRRALTLDASNVRLTRARDPATGMVLEERSRNSGECRTIAMR